MRRNGRAWRSARKLEVKTDPKAGLKPPSRERQQHCERERSGRGDLNRVENR
jgi:hypothetical protein